MGHDNIIMLRFILHTLELKDVITWEERIRVEEFLVENNNELTDENLEAVLRLIDTK